MMQRSSTLVLLAVCALIALCSLAVPGFIYLKILDARTFVSDVEGAIAQANARKDQDRALKQQAAAIEPQRLELEALSIDADKAAAFISEVESVAKESGAALSISSITVGGQTAGRLSTLSLQVSATGNLPTLVQFLRESEVLPEASAVRSVTLERHDKAWVGTFLIDAAIKNNP